MARLPMPTLLALSILTLGTMILHTTLLSLVTPPSHQTTDTEVFGFMCSTLLCIFGLGFYLLSLRPEVAMRCATYALLGANVGCGWLFYAVELGERVASVLWALAPVLGGLVMGVVVHRGEVQSLWEEQPKQQGGKGEGKDERVTDGEGKGAASRT